MRPRSQLQATVCRPSVDVIALNPDLGNRFCCRGIDFVGPIRRLATEIRETEDSIVVACERDSAFESHDLLGGWIHSGLTLWYHADHSFGDKQTSRRRYARVTENPVTSEF